MCGRYYIDDETARGTGNMVIPRVRDKRIAA